MFGSGAVKVFHKAAGSGNALTFSLGTGEQSAFVLLDGGPAAVPDLEALAFARQTLSGLLAVPRGDEKTAAAYLEGLLAEANLQLHAFLSNRVSEEEPEVRVYSISMVFLEAQTVWVAHAGAGRVLIIGGDGPAPVRELLPPGTMAKRMEEDGLVKHWGDAPEAFSLMPSQGLGLPPGDFSPTIRGPIAQSGSWGLILESAAMARQLNPDDYPDRATAEKDFLRLIEYCLSKEPAASPALLALSVGSQGYESAAVEAAAVEAGDEEEAAPMASLLDLGEGPVRRQTHRGLWLLLAGFGVILLMILLLRGQTPQAPDRTLAKPPLTPPPIKTLFQDERARQAEPDAAQPTP